MNRETILRRRIKLLTWVFIIGLAVSGATAIPLEPELDAAAKALGVADKSSTEVAPYALVMGGLRGIPIYWRLIDCSFGVFGIIPVWLCRKWAREIERSGVTTRATPI